MAVLLAEVALAAALGLHGLARKPLWLDEGFTAMAASRGLVGAIDVVRHTDANMPLFTVLLSVSRGLGDGVATLRGLSVLAAAASVPAVYLLAARLFDRVTGLLAGFLLAVAPYVVRYSQELRGYTLVVLLATLGSYCFVVAVETRRSWWFVAYALLAAASCYAHLQAVFVVAAQGVSLAFLAARDVPWRRLVQSWVGIAVLLVPLALVIGSADDHEGYGTPNLRRLPDVLRIVAGGSWALLAVFAALGVIALVTLWRSVRRHGRSWETWRPAFVVCGAAVPFGGVLAAALVVDGNWQPRYVIVVLPMWVVAAAAGIGRIRDRRLAVAVVAVLTALCAVPIRDWYRAPQVEDWPAAVAVVAGAAHTDDGIVFCPAYLRPPYEFVALQSGPTARPRPESPSARWGDGVHQRSTRPRTGAGAVEASPTRLWVVARTDPRGRAAECRLPGWTAGRERVFAHRLGRILVERYDRTGTSG